MTTVLTGTPEPVNRLTTWRMHERGRVVHIVVDGVARCGEPGTGWRTVAGMPRCPVCGTATGRPS